MATRHRITPEIGEEILDLYHRQGYSHEQLSQHLKVAHGLTMSRRLVSDWISEQSQARSIASMRAVGPKVELVMGDEVDKLLKFKSFCEQQFLEVWRHLPDEERFTAKTLKIFADTIMKANAQLYMLHGISEVAKAGATMDDLAQTLNDKFNRIVSTSTVQDAEFTPNASEDLEPEGDE